MNEPIQSTPITEKELMSESEASWHETMAGLRARAAAREEGAAPSAIRALLDSSVKEETKIGPVTLKRASQGTGLTLSRMGHAAKAWFEENQVPEDTQELMGEGLVTIIFMDSEAAYSRFKKEGIELILLEAYDLYFSLPLDQARAISEHTIAQMSLIDDLSGRAEQVPGKPQTMTQDGASPEPQIQPQGMTSPSQNGSCQNTGSPSTMPSGSSPLPPQSSSCLPVTNDTAETVAQATPPMPVSSPATAAANS